MACCQVHRIKWLYLIWTISQWLSTTIWIFLWILTTLQQWVTILTELWIHGLIAIQFIDLLQGWSRICLWLKIYIRITKGEFSSLSMWILASLMIITIKLNKKGKLPNLTSQRSSWLMMIMMKIIWCLSKSLNWFEDRIKFDPSEITKPESRSGNQNLNTKYLYYRLIR